MLGRLRKLFTKPTGTPQTKPNAYTWRCTKCGYTAFAASKEELKALRAAHRPKIGIKADSGIIHQVKQPCPLVMTFYGTLVRPNLLKQCETKMLIAVRTVMPNITLSELNDAAKTYEGRPAVAYGMFKRSLRYAKAYQEHIANAATP